MRLLKQASTAQPLTFLMVDSTDHITGKTGLTCTVTLSKNGGTYAAPSGAVTEVGSGLYKVAGNATDTNTLGPLWLHATATGADPTDVYFDVVAFDPQDGVRLGQTALPNAAAGASGGLPLSVDSSGRVDALKIAGQTQTARDIGASVLLSSGTGTGQVSLSSGAVLLSGTQTFSNTGTWTGNIIGTLSTLTTYTGNTPQTGDSFARVGAAGAGLTALGDTRLANLDAAVSSRSTYAGGDTSGTTTLLSRLSSGRAINLDNLDAAVSTRSTYAGADTAGTGTLLSRVTGPVLLASAYTAPPAAATTATAVRTELATELARIDVATSSRSTFAGGAVASVTAGVTLAATQGLYAPAKAGDAMTLTGAYDAAKTAAQASTALSNVVWTNAKAAFVDAAISGVTAPTASQVAVAVVDQTLAGHTTSGTVGAALVAAGASGDPLSIVVPGNYADGTAGAAIGRLNNTAPDAPVIVIPDAPTSSDLCVVFGYAVNLAGVALANVTITFTLDTSNEKPVKTASGAIYATRQVTAVSDSTGLFSAQLPQGLTFRISNTPHGLRLDGQTVQVPMATQYDLSALPAFS